MQIFHLFDFEGSVPDVISKWDYIRKSNVYIKHMVELLLLYNYLEVSTC